MAYTFTNTVTSLPYGYYVEVVLVSNASTGSLSPTNGGYFRAISPITQGVEIVAGTYRPGDVSFTMRNVGGICQTLFASAASIVQAEIWVSYDAGTTWLNLFYGAVELESVGWTYPDPSETGVREYSFRALHAILQTKYSGINKWVGFTGYEATTQEIYTVGVDEGGDYYYPLNDYEYSGHTMVSINAIYAQMLSHITGQMVVAPASIALNWTVCEYLAKNSTTATEYRIKDTEWYLLYASTGTHVNAGPDYPDKFQALCFDNEAENAQETIRRLSENLNLIPVPSYSAAGVFTVAMIPRFAATYPAIAGTLPVPQSMNRKNAPWAYGGNVVTAGLPAPSTLDSIMGGKNIQMRNYLYTSPQFASPIANDALLIIEAAFPSSGNREGMKNNSVSGYQLWVKNGANDFRVAHTVKFPGSSVYYPASGSSFYGVQHSIFDALFSGGVTAYRTLRHSYDLSYKCLGVGTTEVGLLQTVTVDGIDCYVETISRDVVKNTLTITATEIPT